jgi:predicted DNA-binding protein
MEKSKMLVAVTDQMVRESKGNDKRLVVYVSQELFQELENLAFKEDRSTSNFTRNLIAVAVEQYKKDKNL